MSREVRAFTFLVPAGTPSSAPVSMSMAFPPRTVDVIEIVIPPGPSGVVGFAIQNSGVTVIPYESDDWIVGNNEKITWPLDGYINSGSWQIIGYNTGINDHAVYVRFQLSLPTEAPAPTVALISADDLDSEQSQPFTAISVIG